MHLRLHRRILEGLHADKAKGHPVLKMLGIKFDPDSYHYVKWQQVALADLPDATLAALRAALAGFQDDITGVRLALYDIDRYLKARKSPSKLLGLKARTVRQFEDLLAQVLLVTPGHRVYTRVNDLAYAAYVVTRISYHPAEKHRDGSVTPEHVSAQLAFRRFGQVQTEGLTFWGRDCLRRTAAEALAGKGYVPESAELRGDYLRHLARYTALHDQVGRQVWVSGTGLTDRDDLLQPKDDWRRRDTLLHLDRDGAPTKAVVDLFEEHHPEGGTSKRHDHYDSYFWLRKKLPAAVQEEFDEDDWAEMGLAPDDFEAGGKQGRVDEDDIPVHPDVAIFSLAAHQRVSIHVAQVEDYAYDLGLGEKLVLPDTTHRIVDLLLAHKGVFHDIVKGKGGGAVVLCAGPPGVGKTLTSEVYAEVAGRPLYSVQCSQLGTEPEDLEKRLLAAFTRAQRWHAILLLDEADVYVAKRGTDLQQNAIVGVFLRVLEYYRGVLFLTTNRAESVDDAIASRCLARIDYTIPDAGRAAQMWRILAHTMGVPADEKTVTQLVKTFPQLSGRDIKNLLKLVTLLRPADQKGKRPPLAVADVEFAKQFKPTADLVPNG